MFIRKVRKRNGRTRKIYEYLQFVESVRTEKGPRQRLVLNLGNLELDPSQYQSFARRIEEILTGQRSLIELDKGLEQNARVAAGKIFKKQAGKPATEKGLKAVDIVWKRKEEKYDRETAGEGSYVLRTDRVDLTDEEIWSIYMMLGQIEYAFLCMKSSLGLRPNYHQKEERVDTHMFISVVAYHLFHAIESRLRAGGDRRKWPTVLLKTHERMTIGYRAKDDDRSIRQRAGR